MGNNTKVKEKVSVIFYYSLYGDFWYQLPLTKELKGATKMEKSKLISLGGAIAVMICSFLPVLSYTQDLGSGEYFMEVIGRQNLFIGGLLLLLMLLKWKWRGVVWLLLSIAGAAITPSFANSFYDVAKSVGSAVSGDAYYSNPSYEYGLYLTMLSYFLIAVGSVWDLNLKRRDNLSQPKPDSITHEMGNHQIAELQDDDPTVKLKALQEMLKKDLITQQEFDEKKEEILSRL